MKLCSADGCESKSVACGLCRKHYDMMRRRIPPRKTGGRNGQPNVAKICRERGASSKLVEQRMRLKGLTLEEAISRPIRGRKVRDWFIFSAAKQRKFMCRVCGNDWMTVIPDADTCQLCYHMRQPDIADWIKHA